MRNIYSLAVILILLSTNTLNNVLSQNNTVIDSSSSYAFRIIPSIKSNIYGIALGIVGSETVCNNGQSSSSHGLNIQIIGQGLFLPFNNTVFSYDSIFNSDTTIPKDSLSLKAIHNGLLLSSFGTFTSKVNGLSISALSSYNLIFNGISINLLQTKSYFMNGLSFGIFNQSHLTRGLQLGIINKSKKLKGFQVGIWNVNGKRSLPLINWSFKD